MYYSLFHGFFPLSVSKEVVAKNMKDIMAKKTWEDQMIAQR